MASSRVAPSSEIGHAPNVSVIPPTPSPGLPLFPGDALRGVTEKNQSSSRSPSPYTRSMDEAAKTRKEINVVLRMLTQLEVARFSYTGDDDPDRLVRNLATDATLRGHLTKLKNKLNVLEWRALASKRSILNLDPVVVEKLLDIQRDSASAVGALAVVGATLALSLMYSATRGNMWYSFIAWWCFVISMATTSGLSLAASGSAIGGAGDLLETDTGIDDSTDRSRATPRNWLIHKLSVIVVAFSLIGVAGGWALLAAGAATYNLHGELHNQPPAVSGGPDLGTKGINLANRLVTYLIIGIFVIILIGGYFYRLRPRFHAREYRSVFLASDAV